MYRQSQWHQDGYGWWLQEDGGAGYAVNGWRQVDGSWYYFDGSGHMLTGWQNLGGTWYYMYDNGVMAANTWISNYYLGASGEMVTNTWIGDYYVGGRRRMDPGIWKQSVDPERTRLVVSPCGRRLYNERLGNDRRSMVLF